MLSEEMIGIIQRRNEIAQSNLSDETKRTLLAELSRPKAFPKDIDMAHAEFSARHVGKGMKSEDDLEFTRAVLSYFSSICRTSWQMLAKWEILEKELEQ